MTKVKSWFANSRNRTLNTRTKRRLPTKVNILSKLNENFNQNEEASTVVLQPSVNFLANCDLFSPGYTNAEKLIDESISLQSQQNTANGPIIFFPIPFVDFLNLKTLQQHQFTSQTQAQESVKFH